MFAFFVLINFFYFFNTKVNYFNFSLYEMIILGRFSMDIYRFSDFHYEDNCLGTIDHSDMDNFFHHR